MARSGSLEVTAVLYVVSVDKHHAAGQTPAKGWKEMHIHPTLARASQCRGIPAVLAAGAVAGRLPASVALAVLAPWGVAVPAELARAAREEAQYVTALCAISVAMPRPSSVAAMAPTDPAQNQCGHQTLRCMRTETSSAILQHDKPAVQQHAHCQCHGLPRDLLLCTYSHLQTPKGRPGAAL